MSPESVGCSFRAQGSDPYTRLLAARKALCQSLEKSRELGHSLHKSDERLHNLQERLSPVRRALSPLEGKSKFAEGLSQRIDKAIGPAMLVLKTFDILHRLRVILMRDPREDMDIYLAAFIQLEAALSHLKHDSATAIRLLKEAVIFLGETDATDSHRGRKLQETLNTLQAQKAGGSSELDGGLLGIALNKLEKEFRRLLALHSLPVTLPAQIEPHLEDAPSNSSELDKVFTYPPKVLHNLQAIAARLAGSDQYQRCINAYRDSRSALISDSLQVMGIEYLQHSTPESVDEVPWADLQSMISYWTQQLEVVVKVLYAGERRLARQVFRDLGQPVWVECLSNLAQPGMNAFMQFGDSVAKSSRYPEKILKLLEMFESMDNCEHSVIQVFDGHACQGIRSQYRELLKQVVYSASETFWDIELWVEEQNEPHAPGGNVMKICSFLVNFLNYLNLEFPNSISKVLRIENSKRSNEGPEERGLDQGVLQALNALEKKVEERAKEYQDPALQHIFMMNNLFYVRNRVKKNDLKPLVGDSWISDLGRKVEKHALKYQKEGWQHVLTHLSREGLLVSSGSKTAARQLVRQRLRAFTSAFDEAVQTQSKWVIQDEHLKDGTLLAVTQSVVPAYTNYLQSFGHLLEGHLHTSNKYVKYTPETLEQMLEELFTPFTHQRSINGRSVGNSMNGRSVG